MCGFKDLDQTDLGMGLGLIPGFLPKSDPSNARLETHSEWPRTFLHNLMRGRPPTRIAGPSSVLDFSIILTAFKWALERSNTLVRILSLAYALSRYFTPSSSTAESTSYQAHL